MLRPIVHYGDSVLHTPAAPVTTFDDSLRFLDPQQLQRLNGILYRQQSSTDVRINERLRRLAAANRLDFIDRQSLVCPSGTSLCHVRAQDGAFLYTDTNHWSLEGRQMFGRQIVDRFGQFFAAGSVPPPAAQR